MNARACLSNGTWSDWLQSAAVQNFAAAQIDFAIIYLQGKGVDVELDNPEGYKWALIGEANGDPRGKDICKFCEESLDQEELRKGRESAEFFLSSNN